MRSILHTSGQLRPLCMHSRNSWWLRCIYRKTSFGKYNFNSFNCFIICLNIHYNACCKKSDIFVHSRKTYLLHAILHFGADVGSKTRAPFSHSTQELTPFCESACAQVGWVHSLQPILFLMSLNGGWLKQYGHSG